MSNRVHSNPVITDLYQHRHLEVEVICNRMLFQARGYRPPTAPHTSIIGNLDHEAKPLAPKAYFPDPSAAMNTHHTPVVASSSTPSADPGPITLDVGGRIFRTYRVTLQDSQWLYAWTERWLSSQPLDSPLFLDADPDLFEHILRYLRRQEVFPLFWSRDRGFDYDLYNRLEAEAGHFGIPALEDWIKEKKYLQAVTVKRGRPLTQSMDELGVEKEFQSTEYERYTSNKINRIYLCPRNIPVHRGRRGACGMACERARGDDPLQFEEEEYVEVITIAKTIEFDPSVCRL